MFFDEFGFSFQERLGRSWAPRGKRPVVRRVTKDRRAMSTAVGLTLTGHIYKRHFKGSVNSLGVVATLRHLRRHMVGGFVLIWDRAGIHKSQTTQAFLAAHPEIDVERLPPYAPELNPEEYCHGNVKRRLRNVLPADTRQMRVMVDHGFARLRHRRDMLLNFFHQAGLTVRKLWLV